MFSHDKLSGMTQRRVMVGFILFLTIATSAPSLALAANALPSQIVPEECNQKGGCQSICDLAQVAHNILNTGIYIAVFLSAILFAWAGWLYLTDVANAGQHSKAVEVFQYVATGLVIILIGWLVVDVLIRTLAGDNFSSWNKIC